MNNKSDNELRDRFVAECARRGFTLSQMGAVVGHTKAWASKIINGKTKRPHWRTRNLMRRFLGEI